ncbi:hypothetical protein CDL15_Pgr018924 [Punica granatum]|uniref:PHD-type domain-containing protein n=1 Tax=Punica granatum TaxID=22663 RepID=A0A218WLZ8_PUNGR|nr:hypothetical protein CDL15_Pgr018924 [Punica granatum]PKI66778.1 hypothetical protein CRG98_012784 [Punica granatum]
MGKKICARRARYSRTTPAPPSASASSSASKRLDFPDEDGAERGNVPDTLTGGNSDILSKDSDPMGTNSSPKKKVPPRKSQDGYSQESAGSSRVEKKVCVRCGKRGQMLVCSEAGCPVAIHEKCLPCKPKSDESGNYYCPYCSYKRMMEKVEMSRRKAILAKQALSNFLDARVGHGLQKPQKDGGSNRKQASSSPLGNQNRDDDGVGVENDRDDCQFTDQDQAHKSVNEVLATPSGKCDEVPETRVDQSASSAHGQHEETSGVVEGVQEKDSPAVVDQPQKETSNSCHELTVRESRENQETSNACQVKEKTRGGKRKHNKQHQTGEATKSTTKVDVPDSKQKANAETEKSESDAEGSPLYSKASTMKEQYSRAHHENVETRKDPLDQASLSEDILMHKNQA